MPKKVAQKTVAPKKVVSKKLTPKKKVSVQLIPLVYAENAKSFWLHDGQVLNSLVALSEALREMEKSVFSHHVNSKKNDFADWVDAVLCDAECADGLRKTKTPKSAYTVVVKRLKVYEV